MFETTPVTVSENETSVEACILLSNTNLQRSIVVSAVPQSVTATSKTPAFAFWRITIAYNIVPQVSLISFSCRQRLSLEPTHKGGSVFKCQL